MLAGETADLIIGSTQSMEGLALEGKIDPGTRVTFARVGVGVVVPTEHHETADRVGRGAQARPARVIEGSAGIQRPTSAGWPARPRIMP